MPGIDYSELKRRIGMPVVLDALQWKPSVRRGSELRGPCPIHGTNSSRSRTFVVDVSGNRFHCFGCEAGGNQLDLFMEVTKLDVYRAAIELCRRVGVPVPFSGNPEQRRGTSQRRPTGQCTKNQRGTIPPPLESVKAMTPLFSENKEDKCVWRV